MGRQDITMKTLRSPSDLRLPKGIPVCTVSIIRESPGNYSLKDSPILDTPERAAQAFANFYATDPMVDQNKETMSVAILTTRRKLAAFSFVSHGTLDTIMCVPSDIFRLAIVANSNAIILCHNHPSGDVTPSEGDIRTTRELVRAGKILKIEVLDHIIIGNPAFGYERKHSSLRGLGYFYE